MHLQVDHTLRSVVAHCRRSKGALPCFFRQHCIHLQYIVHCVHFNESTLGSLYGFRSNSAADGDSEFIRQRLTESGAPPTRDEISQAFGFRSLNAAEQHLQALQKKGLIELVAGTSRGIRLKDSVRELMLAAQESGLPVIGKVAAGSPILAQENVMATAAVDPATLNRTPTICSKCVA